MNLLQTVKGYVCISVQGLHPEKWINIAIRRGIPVWRLTRQTDGSFTLCIPRTHYRKQTKTICGKTGCRTRVLSRHGLFYHIRHIKHRKALTVAIILACALICFLNSLVWSVDILPGERVTDADVFYTRQLLLRQGVKPGVFMDSVEKRDVASYILQNQSGICWVQVRRQGTKLFVEIERGILPENETVDERVPCDIVADKDFEVVKCVVYSGTATCKPGQVVHKGEVVVSGTADGVHAQAEIVGRTWYSAKVEVVADRTVVRETGRETKQTAFFLFGVKIPLPGETWLPWYRKMDTSNCSQVETLTYWRLPGGMQLPLGIHRLTTKETAVVPVRMNEEEALAYARLQGADLLDQKIPDDAQIHSTAWKITENEDGTLFYEITAECTETVGVKNVDKL